MSDITQTVTRPIVSALSWRALALTLVLACGHTGDRDAAPEAPETAPTPAPDPRDRQIEMTARLVRVTDEDDPQRPDFLFRLGELCAARWSGPGPADREPQRWFARAEEAYRDAIRFADYHRRDEALFKLGLLLQSAGQEEAARGAFDTLIKEHPSSPLVPEAWGHRR